MIGRLIKWGLVILAAILVYNYFYGTSEEKKTSVKIFNEVKELGTSVKDALSQEKERYEEGKYDGLIDQLNDVWNDISSNVSSEKDSEALKKLRTKKDQLAEDLNSYRGKDTSERHKILEDMEQFMMRADSLLRDNEN